jgi:hypothetical protein
MLAEGAGGVQGGRLWASLSDLIDRPPASGTSGRRELDALRQAPRDGNLAEALAGIMLERGATDPAFGQALAAWRGQGQIRVMEEMIGRAERGAPSQRGEQAGPARAAPPAPPSAAAPARPGDAPPRTSGPASGADGTGQAGEAGARGRWQRILSGQYAVTIIGGTIAAVAGGVALALVLGAFSGSSGANPPAAGRNPTPRVTAPASGSANVPAQPVPSKCEGVQPASGLTASPHPPLAILSEQPMGILGIGYVLPGSHVLSSAQLGHLNVVKNGLTGTVSYLSSMGGYSIAPTGTQLVVRNKSSKLVRILGIKAVKESCQPPLGGTLFSSSSSGADFTINLGFDLDSPDSEARAIKGSDINPASPNYFNTYTVTIKPGRQQAFNLVATTTNHAWTFTYQVSMLDGNKQMYQLIGNGTQPFRLTSRLPASQIYRVAYIGGPGSPAPNGAWKRVNPNDLYG